MAEQKTMMIIPLVDIIHKRVKHEAGSKDPFEVPVEMGERLIKGKKAKKAE